MGTIISILIILVCVLLILVVLIQNPKGGGLSSGLTGGSQVMGVRRTADFLEKATWTLAIALLLFSLFAAPYSKKASAATPEENSTESVTRKKAGENMVAPAPPSAPGINSNAPAPITPAAPDSAK